MAQGRVIVGVDGSDDALRAVHYAMREAEVHGSRLLVVHGVDDAVLAGTWGSVYDPSVLEDAGRHAVDEAVAQAVGEGFPAERVHGEVLVGNPASVLIRCSEEADRVVVGRRAGGGLERIFVGSTSVAVAAGARCPVIMISAATNPDETGGHRRIGVAVGTDGPIRGTGAMGWAFDEAAVRGAALTIVHVIEPPTPGLFGRARHLTDDQRTTMTHAATEQIERAIEPLLRRHGDVDVDLEVSHGHGIDTLVRRSEELDLLIVGAHSGGLGQGLGGLVRGVMGHARCPVGIRRAR